MTATKVVSKNGQNETRKDSDWSSLSDDEKKPTKTAALKKQETDAKQEKPKEEEEDEFSKFLQIQNTIKKRKNSVGENNLVPTASYLGRIST